MNPLPPPDWRVAAPRLLALGSRARAERQQMAADQAFGVVAEELEAILAEVLDTSAALGASGASTEASVPPPRHAQCRAPEAKFAGLRRALFGPAARPMPAGSPLAGPAGGGRRRAPCGMQCAVPVAVPMAALALWWLAGRRAAFPRAPVEQPSDGPPWQEHLQSKAPYAPAVQSCDGPPWQEHLESKAPYSYTGPAGGDTGGGRCPTRRSFYVARHCSRHPRKTKWMLKLREALAGLSAPGWEAVINATIVQNENSLEQCSPCGLDEHRSIGWRLHQHLGGAPLLVHWSATEKRRVVDSAKAWRQGVEEAGVARFVPESSPKVAACSDDIFEFSKLRFFDSCVGLQENKTNRWKPWVASNGSVPKIGRRVLERMGISPTSLVDVGDDQLRTVAISVYKICQTEVNVGLYGEGHWCALLREDEAAVMATTNYLKHCFKHGPCAHDAIATLQACPLLAVLRDFLQPRGANASDGGPDGEVPVEAFFAHAETLTPLLALLGMLPGEGAFHCLPMSANLRVDVLQCPGGGETARAWLNELPAEWPGCGKECPVDVLTERLEAVLGPVAGCGRRGFEALCGSLSCGQSA